MSILRNIWNQKNHIFFYIITNYQLLIFDLSKYYIDSYNLNMKVKFISKKEREQLTASNKQG